MKETPIKSLEEMKDFALSQLKVLKKESRATILALSGDLGSGKTAFTKMLAEVLGVKETVTSPTFVIEKIYAINHEHFTHLIHIDAYRLNDEKELLQLGWEEIISNPQNLIVIEWPERVKKIIPHSAHNLHFKFVDELNRLVRIK